MGLMDRVKTQATVLAQRTQETARDSKAKLDEVQARRRAEAMLRDLGTAVYAERTGRSTADTDSKIDKLVADLAAYETEHGVNLTGGPSAKAPADGAGESADATAESAGATGESADGTGESAGGSGAASEDTGTTQV
jgi:hypothetical protein